ncbi:hypothetical protein D3C86_1745510 [compost metagenome]
MPVHFSPINILVIENEFRKSVRDDFFNPWCCIITLHHPVAFDQLVQMRMGLNPGKFHRSNWNYKIEIKF